MIPIFEFEKEHANMLAKWEQFFRDFSYKPNWSFDLDGDRLMITMRVPDSRRPLPDAETNVWGKKQVVPLVPISKTITLHEFFGEDYAKDLIRFHIRDMEDHEIDEWFRYKGELPFDPHKED